MDLQVVKGIFLKRLATCIACLVHAGRVGSCQSLWLDPADKGDNPPIALVISFVALINI